jgi:hypothetical protein
MSKTGFKLVDPHLQRDMRVATSHLRMSFGVICSNSAQFEANSFISPHQKETFLLNIWRLFNNIAILLLTGRGAAGRAKKQ